MTRYTFRITESFTPTTIPMARLAEYMAEYAKLLGESKGVHFDRIVDQSVGVVAVVEDPCAVRVQIRLHAVERGDGPDDAARAMKRLDDMLAADNAVGELLHEGDRIIAFPGRNRAVRQFFGPFTQVGAIEGEVIRIGGQDDTIHVHLRDGDHVHTACVTTHEIGRQLGHYLLGPIVRVLGEGRWVRYPDGQWELRQFRIRGFEVLGDDDLPTLVSRLRAVPGNKWDEVSNPVETVLDERGGNVRSQPH
ncbi:hypothetical protein ACSBOB_00735 [Mesorhizobium sp. ASY16-5R]|uniref:hypothetical protein n=1 Tax=Mesorhizobium sp. ASY16-5R TaxID=3445772 RepID=UPI003FA16CEE